MLICDTCARISFLLEPSLHCVQLTIESLNSVIGDEGIDGMSVSYALLFALVRHAGR